MCNVYNSVHTDVDECEAEASPCPANSDCLNTVGSYECPCRSGYNRTLSQLHEDCEGIHNYLETNDGCMQTTCSYADIDECLESIFCQDICINTIGSFMCQCSQGRLLATDNRTCEGSTSNFLLCILLCCSLLYVRLYSRRYPAC